MVTRVDNKELSNIDTKYTVIFSQCFIDLKSICGNKCGNGVCRPVDSDMQYDCECNKGFRLNTDTGICEGKIETKVK